MADHPRVREDLVIERARVPAGLCWHVRDPVRATTFWFGDPQHRVLMALDGRRPAAEIAAALAPELGVGVEVVAELLEGFGRAGLLVEGRPEGPPSAAPEPPEGQLAWLALADVLAEVATPTQAATSDCELCELHCCTYRIDVASDELAALQEAVATLKTARPRLLSEDREGVPSGMVSLARSADDTCVLLDDRGLCSVHAAHGEDRKPRVCRLYPAVPLLTPDGPRTGLRMGCAHPGRTFDPAAVMRTRRLLLELAGGMPTLTVWGAPEEVRVAAGVDAVPWARWRGLEEGLMARVQDGVDAPAGLAAGARWLAAEVGAALPPAPAPEALEAALADAAIVLAIDADEEEAAVVRAVAAGEPGPWPSPFPAPLLAEAVHSLEPLHADTALAGLGRLALWVAFAGRDHRSRTSPHAAAAFWGRVLERKRFGEVIGRVDLGVLEALAVHPLA